MNKTAEERFWSKVDKRSDDECWNWTGAKLRDGYGNMKVNGKNIQAHRYSYILNYDIDITGFDVLHHCDNSSCVNPAHLFLGNDIINSQDRVMKNRQIRGENHPHHKVTSSDVIKAREMYSSGTYSMRKLARLFNICYSEMNAILNERTWRYT